MQDDISKERAKAYAENGGVSSLVDDRLKDKITAIVNSAISG